MGYYEWLLLGVITLQPNNQGYNIMFGSPIKSTKVCIEQEEGLLTEMKQVCWTEKSAIYHILIQFHNDSDSFSFQLCITDSPEYQQIIDAWGLVSSWGETPSSSVEVYNYPQKYLNIGHHSVLINLKDT